MYGQPGDKSPGYDRASLRDEVNTGFQMSKQRQQFYRVNIGSKTNQIQKVICGGSTSRRLDRESLEENFEILR